MAAEMLLHRVRVLPCVPQEHLHGKRTTNVMTEIKNQDVEEAVRKPALKRGRKSLVASTQLRAIEPTVGVFLIGFALFSGHYLLLVF